MTAAIFAHLGRVPRNIATTGVYLSLVLLFLALGGLSLALFGRAEDDRA